MTEDARYRTPQALNRAITDRLRTLSAETGQPLQDLRRQFAYDRFLSRVFTAQPERWVLKGGTAMLARLGAYARHSDDIDLLSQTQGVSESEALLEAELALRQAVTTDLNDQFRFTLDPGRRVADGGIALRVTVTAFLGVTEFARFHVDLVVGLHMTGSPDTLGALVAVDLPGLAKVNYVVYPIVDHIADKVCAFFVEHRRRDGESMSSTRFRDLVDLVLFAHNAAPAAGDLRHALQSERARRNLVLPTTFPTPAAPGWRQGYQTAARDARDIEETDLDRGLETARRFIDPVLSGTATGVWDPDSLEWVGDTMGR
ncbi:MAG: hypothetical protein C4558_05210 [Dehalococcoidia bacterium]|nr:MAG: hypothetical protein C4558_05210 [Dehalococcoidia bacterium]